jgi:hypothetical protein
VQVPRQIGQMTINRASVKCGYRNSGSKKLDQQPNCA